MMDVQVPGIVPSYYTGTWYRSDFIPQVPSRLQQNDVTRTILHKLGGTNFSAAILQYHLFPILSFVILDSLHQNSMEK